MTNYNTMRGGPNDNSLSGAMLSSSGQVNTSGVDLYYQRRIGSAQQNRQRTGGAQKRGQFKKGYANKLPLMAAIQNTQNSLLQQLGVEKSQLAAAAAKNETWTASNYGLSITPTTSSLSGSQPNMFSQGLAGMNASVKASSFAGSNSNRGAPIQPTNPTPILQSNQAQAGAAPPVQQSSAATAAAAAAAVVLAARQRGPSPVRADESSGPDRNYLVENSNGIFDESPSTHSLSQNDSQGQTQGKSKQRSARKGVTWNTTLTSSVLNRQAVGTDCTDMPTSILAVGGSGQTHNVGGASGNMNTNMNVNSSMGSKQSGSGVAYGQRGNGIGNSNTQSLSNSMSQLRGSTDSAAVFIRSNSCANNDMLSGDRPHTSGSLDLSLSQGQKKSQNNANAGSANGPGSGTASNSNNRHRPLLEMRRDNNSDTRPQRPSLSEQLAAISASAGALTDQIRADAGLDKNEDKNDPPIVVLPAKSLSVGTLCCRYPSPARFYRDRIEYCFHHPYENTEISMSMHYTDMLQPALTSGRLKFKLPRRLMHFQADFNPNNPMHVITIELGTTAASTIIREKIMPMIRTSSGKRRI